MSRKKFVPDFWAIDLVEPIAAVEELQEDMSPEQEFTEEFD